MVRTILAGVALLVASACSFDPQPLTGPGDDASEVIRSDGGTGPGPADAETGRDADTVDAAAMLDAGAQLDAGTLRDAGMVDAGPDCGNGFITPDEACDDQNRVAGDGCSDTCTVEPGWTCEGAPSLCAPIPPRLSIAGSSAAEGDVLTFTLTLSAAAEEDVTFEWTTMDGTAEAGSDYNAGSGSSAILEGQTEATITIPTILDTIFEPIETMQIVVTEAGGANIALGTATGIIAGPPLVDDGLVVRYFLDEQASGVPAGPVRDAAASPLDLTVNGSPIGPEYLAGTDLNRGLFWTTTGNSGWVSAPVEDTKVVARLDGTQRLTLEVLVHAQDAPDFSRLIHIGSPSDRGAISLNLSNSNIELLREGRNNVVWSDSTLDERGRVLITLTFDSLQPGTANRLELYYDGEPSGVRSPSAQPFGEQLEIDDGAELYIGNRGDGNRSLAGWIGYVAIYEVVLDEDAVRQNAHRILVRDDSGLP